MSLASMPRMFTRVFHDEGDWRTLLLILFVYLFWFTLVFLNTALPLWLVLLFLIPLVTLQSSLQHEVLHGHPFSNALVNEILISLPIGILLPYRRFRDCHLAHHQDARLCDPHDDPESWYQPEDQWNMRSKLGKAIFNFNNVLVGRMILGPAIGMIGFYKMEIKKAVKGRYDIFVVWIVHFALVAAIILAVLEMGKIPLWLVFLSAYGGMALLMVRTFLEHQVHERMRGRSVIIENGGVFGFLFLNNSLHSVHHSYPGVSWFRLPKLFADNRERFLQMNDHYSFKSYGEVFRKFAFKRKEPVAFPEKFNRAFEETL